MSSQCHRPDTDVVTLRHMAALQTDVLVWPVHGCARQLRPAAFAFCVGTDTVGPFSQPSELQRRANKNARGVYADR